MAAFGHFSVFGKCPTLVRKAGQSGRLISRSHLAIYECTAYIPDMSREDSKRARQRQRQARYEARQRAGVALYPAPWARSRSTP